jgi:hypothetical protein
MVERADNIDLRCMEHIEMKIGPIGDAKRQNSTKFSKLPTNVEKSRMMYEHGEN